MHLHSTVLTTGYIIRKTKTSDDFGLDFDPLTDYENNEAKVIDFSFVIFTLLLHMIV